MRHPQPLKGSTLFRLPSRANALKQPSTHLESLLLYAFFHIPLTLLFAVILFKSMSWETVIDTPMFMYSGFLMDKLGMVPVRDFFTYNMIGTHVIFRWLYHFFGGSILGMRLADTFVLAIVLLLFARVLKPYGLRVAWAGCLMFGILHVTLGQHVYLQRDYLALVPLQLAVLSATAWFKSRPSLRYFMTGAFVASMATIKPHLIVGAIVFFVYLILDTEQAKQSRRDLIVRSGRIAAWCCIGGMVPLIWMAGYLAYYGVLGKFLTILIEYFPLHADINGSHVIFADDERFWYRFEKFFGTAPWDYYQVAMGVGAGLALYVTEKNVTRKERLYGNLMLALTLVYMFYPVIAARFYDHHYYPFRLFSLFFVAYLFKRWTPGTSAGVKTFAWGMAAFIITGMFYVNYETLQVQPSRVNPYFRTARITQWMKPRLQAGDKVQALEWAFCGSTHALLLTEATPATRTIWGEVLFHHLDSPFVQDLRKEFIEELTASKPRFIIETKVEYDYVTGTNCSKDFPELQAFLAQDYFMAIDSNAFRLWEANTSPTAQKDREQFELKAAHSGDEDEDKAPVPVRVLDGRPPMSR